MILMLAPPYSTQGDYGDSADLSPVKVDQQLCNDPHDVGHSVPRFGEDHVGLHLPYVGLFQALICLAQTYMGYVDCCAYFDHVMTMALRGSMHRDCISSEGPWMSVAIRLYREWRPLFV